MNPRIVLIETLRLLACLFCAGVFLTVLYFTIPERNKSEWCNVKSMECYERLGSR